MCHVKSPPRFFYLRSSSNARIKPQFLAESYQRVKANVRNPLLTNFVRERQFVSEERAREFRFRNLSSRSEREVVRQTDGDELVEN